ncbi:MAG: insulinase family protein [Coriobacteriales bacterium]|nr:insulinase family protein [Coriobacteriales bacterium]
MSNARKTDYATPMAHMAPGTTHAGFVVTNAIPLPELSGVAYVMRHEQTGARTLWVACDDENKVFSIAFKTPPANDTGVFHIIEHSVLCGSECFPVKEPFVNLLKTSMQTFLNALTFADKTMYPVASTNTADLENLMDVYLDAVLHPNIYTRPRIFEQEGWHLELGEDGSLAYNGVVFNEMKGATSDPDDVLGLAMDRALFPQTAYRFESGGDPRAIPQLTYEEFVNAHARHYDLSNSYVILYGDMDVERELAFVGKRLCAATVRDAGSPNPLELQAPVTPPPSRVEMATAPENASVALGYVLGTASDRERVLACDVLFDALAGSNEAPLKRALLDAGLADDVVVSLLDGELQPRVMIQLKGAKPGVADEFCELVQTTCARLVEKGIGHDLLAASLAQAEFNLREQDFGSYPTGIAVAIQVMSSWLYDDERPVDYLRYEDELAHMKAGLDDGYFERLLREVVCQSEHCAQVELVPVVDGAAAQEAAELAERAAKMSEEDRRRIVEEVSALRAEQEAPDDPAEVAKLPRLALSDIDEAREDPAGVCVEAPLPCMWYDLDTRHIDYVYHYFDLRGLSFEDIPYVGVLCDLLGKLGTSEHDAASLDTLIELNLGSLNFFVEAYAYDDNLLECAPFLIVGASALSEKVDRLAQIPCEVWGKTSFADTDRILAILQQRRIVLEQQFVNAGHAAAMARLGTHYSVTAKLVGWVSGIDYYGFLKGLLADWDANKDELPMRLAQVASCVFGANNAAVTFVGSAQDLDRFWEVGGNLGLSHAQAAGHELQIPEPVPANEAFVIPSNVCYVGAGTGRSAHNVDDCGLWQVCQRILSYDYLWNEVRVKGGAYGSGFRHLQTGQQQFWSYRDPGIDATLARYDAASAWLESWEPTDDELVGYVVSAVASHDSPAKPRQIARRQDALRLAGKPADWRARVRAQLLAATPDALRDLARPLADVATQRTVCVFGPAEAIEASGVAFDTVVDLMGA